MTAIALPILAIVIPAWVTGTTRQARQLGREFTEHEGSRS